MPCIRLAASIALAVLLCAGPALAQYPPPAAEQPLAPTTPLPLQPGDAFGQEVTLPERTIIYLKGHSTWDTAFETLVDAFKSLKEYLDKQGIKPTGPAMTIYTQTDDTGFNFEAALPVAEPPKIPPKGDIAAGQTPTGKALKFVHRGSYDAMDATYEAITNYLDDKQLEAKDLFIEEYATDPLTTDADKLVINVYVPVK
jgi:effector-binding domain-containing protein